MAALEQRNSYKGQPERAWIRLRVVALDGSVEELDVLADTGNPFPLILSESKLRQFKQLDLTSVTTNFGMLEGGWVHVQIPAIALDEFLPAYGSDAVVAAAQGSSSDFQGLAGLPILRLAEYGGHANEFWNRSAAQSP
jgi:hypothetical protein